MQSIGLFSDTHGFLDPMIFEHFKDCDEVWHAGDFGGPEIVHQLQEGFHSKILRGVYGNIDETAVRYIFPERILFDCEQVKVMMQHIGGYPGKYAPGIKDLLFKERPKIFISGHSHILKIQFDQQLDCLHINPGAAGKQGWHQMRTAVRFKIEGHDIKDCEIIELGKRS